MQGKLTVIHGTDQGRTISVRKTKVSIGRSQRCTLCLQDTKISGNHCEIELSEEQFWIKDLGSTNGTLVNQQPVSRIALKHEDTILLGKTILKFEIIAEEPIITEMTEVFDQGDASEHSSQIINSYRILDKIYECGYIAEYKVEHTVLKNILLLKTLALPPQACEDSTLLQALLELKRLRNHGMVSFYDVFWHEQNLVLIMDYIQGRTLQQLLNSKIILSWKKALKITFYIALAMEYIHSKGIQHGYLSCNNIILEEGTKTIKLNDVGLWSILEKHQCLVQDWMLEHSLYRPIAAEQASGITNDLYSLGCVFLFLLMGKIPDGSPNPKEWMKLIPKDCPAGFHDVLKKVLLEPAYPNVREFYQALAQIAKGAQAT